MRYPNNVPELVVETRSNRRLIYVVRDWTKVGEGYQAVVTLTLRLPFDTSPSQDDVRSAFYAWIKENMKAEVTG